MKSLYKNISLIKFEIIYIAYWLRFSGDETYIRNSLENIAKVTGGKRMPKGSSLINKPNNHPYITVSNMNNDFEDLSTYQYVPIEIYPQIKNYIVDHNDLIISVAGTLGLVKKVPRCLDKANLTENANRISEIKIDEDYLQYYLNTSIIQNRILAVQTNNAQPKLALKEIRNFKITYPSIEEQKKVSRFLSVIDKKINLLENKKEQYKDFKKYLMQQIFAQKLRFDFKIEWRQCKLKDLLTVKSSNISINQLEDNTGEYPLYGASGFLKNIDFCEMETDYISIVKDGSGVGNLSFHEKKSSIVNTSQYLLPKKDFDIHFLYYQLQTLNLLKYVNGSSIPHIYFKDYCIEKVTVPSLPEQQKIGKLFVDTDKTLENIDNNIRVTQEFKKGLLQQMFVYILKHTILNFCAKICCIKYFLKS